MLSNRKASSSSPTSPTFCRKIKVQVYFPAGNNVKTVNYERCGRKRYIEPHRSPLTPNFQDKTINKQTYLTSNSVRTKMVRKRTRKYDSDDNDSDSDLDFDFNAGSQQPAPKKYSLRERKRAPTFTTDFDYYGLDEDEERKQSSDDEDFEVEADVEAAGGYESDSGPQNSEGLIDFEDIIRADIVVNKNKIDYDNLIQKTEIKLTQPKRRGRKPKNYVEAAEEKPTVFENDTQALAHLENEEQDDKKDITEPEISFCEGEGELPNGDSLENGDCNKVVGESDPLAMRHANNAETEVAKAPPVEEGVRKTEQQEKIVDDEDDDVIVLGELKQDVIVLDD